MTTKPLKTASAIVDALKDANSFDEARAALAHIGTLPQAEKQSFADRLYSGDLAREFGRAATPGENRFRIVFIEALNNDVTTAAKPQFRIVAKDPSPKR
jgi:hypothetical protein